MAWFGPAGECGCCERCECKDIAAFARRFANTPTVKVVIDIDVDEISYSMATPGFGPPLSWYDTFRITGMSSLSGTYFFELQKTAQGCIDEYSDSNEVISIGSVTAERTRRVINLSTCVVTGTPTVTTETTPIGLQVKTEWGFLPPYVYAFLFKSWSNPFAAPFHAQSATACIDNYVVRPFTNQDYLLFPYSNNGKVQTNIITSLGTQCGTVDRVIMDWGTFEVTVEDL